jgi:hypothetical protein
VFDLLLAWFCIHSVLFFVITIIIDTLSVPQLNRFSAPVEEPHLKLHPDPLGGAQDPCGVPEYSHGRAVFSSSSGSLGNLVYTYGGYLLPCRVT